MISNTMTRKSPNQVAVSLAIVVSLVLLLISKDSYTHDLFNKADSGWFFMCGKAWMSGLRPYVDFADSKGPLLWLIYGIGYLMSHHDFIGVFWLSCVAYSVTLYFHFLTANLFLADRRKAFLAAGTMMLFYFFPVIHNEVRCEDFAIPWLSMALWHASCLIVGYGRHRLRRWTAMGMSLGALLMMKWNLILLPLAVMLVVAVATRNRLRKSVSTVVVAAVAGVAFIVLPFVAYFLLMGTWNDFIHEYFVNPLRITTVGVKPYYFTILMPLMIFPTVMLLRGRKVGKLLSLGGVAAVAVVVVVANLWAHDFRHADYGDFFTQDNIARWQFYQYEYVVAQADHPRIVSMGGYMGVGTCSEALPACKYWARQSGATPQMDSLQMDCCRKKEADFVLVHTDLQEAMEAMRRFGYYETNLASLLYPFVLYSKRQPKLPPDEFHVTNGMVLMKRVSLK